MRVMEVLQDLFHPNTTPDVTRPAMVIGKPTEHTRVKIRPTAYIPGAGLTEKETRSGTFVKVREPSGRIVTIPVTEKVWKANKINRPFVRSI